MDFFGYSENPESRIIPSNGKRSFFQTGDNSTRETTRHDHGNTMRNYMSDSGLCIESFNTDNVGEWFIFALTIAK